MTEWKTGTPTKSGEYIVMIEGARRPTCLDFDLKLDGAAARTIKSEIWFLIGEKHGKTGK